MILPLGTGRSESFLIKEGKTALVDTGVSANIDAFLELMARHDTKPQDLSLIIITHGHIDHFALLPELRKLCSAPVLCHEAAAQAITSGISIPSVLHSGMARLLIRVLGIKEPHYSPGLVPDITVSGETDLKPYGINAKIIPTPGHTDCSLSVITEKGEALIGDILLDRPLSKKPHYTFVASDPVQMAKSLETIYRTGCHTLYGAHARKYTSGQVSRLIKQQKPSINNIHKRSLLR